MRLRCFRQGHCSFSMVPTSAKGSQRPEQPSVRPGPSRSQSELGSARPRSGRCNSAVRWILGPHGHRNARKQSERGVSPDVILTARLRPANLSCVDVYGRRRSQRVRQVEVRGSQLLTYIRLPMRLDQSSPRATMDVRALPPQRRRSHAGPDTIDEGKIIDLLVQ